MNEEVREKPRSNKGLFLSMLFLVSIVLVLTAIVQILFTLATQRQAIHDQQEIIATEAGNIVKSFVQEKLDLLSHVTEFSDIDSFTKDEKELTLDKLLGSEPAFRQVVLLSYDGQEFFSRTRLAYTTESQTKTQLDYKLVGVVSLGKPYIGETYIDSVSNEPLIVLAVPTKDVFGEPNGSLVAEVNLKFMWDLVADLKVGKGGQAYVVDKKGRLIAYKDINRILAKENLKELKKVQEFVYDEESSSNLFVKGISSTNVVSSHVSLKTPDWALVVEFPATEAYGNVILAISISVISVIFGVLIMLAFVLYSSRKFVLI